MIILRLFAAAALLFALIFPEIIVTHTLSFVRLSDYLLDYYATFILTNFFYQGGIQLWDSFAQMPHAFFFITFGMFKFPNIVTALAYYLLAPFSDKPAELYQHVFSVVFMLSLLFLRVVGIFLLLRRITRQKWLLWVCTVIFSVLFCGPALSLGDVYESYYPLLMYFILNFFTYWRTKDLGWGTLLFCIILVHSFVSTGYFYLGIHFFIVSCLVWAWCERREQFGTLFNKAKTMYYYHWRMAGLVLIAAFIILAPYLYLQQACFKDYALNIGESRLSHMWSVGNYFDRLQLTLAPVNGFFARMLDFTETMGDRTFFYGYMVFFLSVTGVVLWRDSRKWIFVATIIFIWMINFPRNESSVGLIAHWINALTNPLKTFARGYNIAGFSILPYLFMPLMVMGMESIVAPVGPGARKAQRNKWLLVVMIMGVFVFTGLAFLAPLAKIYAVIFFLMSAIAAALLATKNRIRNDIKVGVLFLFLAVDGCFIANQLKQYFHQYGQLQPLLIQSEPQLGAVGLDYQNPKILPFKEHFIFQFSYQEEPVLWFPHNMTGSYYHVSNYAMMYLMLDSHNPRHIAFKDWTHDPDMLEYLTHQDHMLFFVQNVIPASDTAFDQICRLHLEDRVAMVEDPPQDPSVRPDVPEDLKSAPTDEIKQWNYFTVPMDRSSASSRITYKGSMMLYSFALPDDFPAYTATSIFGDEDPMLHFIAVDADGHPKEFQQAQGDLVKPDTFDVNNIRDGFVTAAFNAGDFAAATRCVLAYPKERAQGVINVWNDQADNLGITYRCPQRGWIIFHYPFDPKWQITVDGKQVHIYRVNKCFIGFPVSQGDHRVLVRYWPDTSLRLALALSAILAMFCQIAMIYFAVREPS